MKTMFWGSEIHLLELVFIGVILLFMRLPFTDVPFERDEGGYAYGAQIMDSGDVAYRDTFEHKGPLPFFLYWTSFKLFGEKVSSVRLMLDLWLAAAVFVLYLFTSRLIHRQAAFFAALVFVLLSSKPIEGAGTAALTEQFLMLPVIAGAMTLISGIGTGSGFAVFISGICMGLGVMSKQTVVFETLFILIFGITQLARSEQKQRIPRFISTFVSGFMVFPLLFLLYFFLKSALREFIDFAFLYNFLYPSLNPSTGITEHFLLFLVQVWKIFRGNAIIILAIISGMFFLVQHKERSIRVFLLGWCIASALAVFITLRFFLHYFQQLYLPLSIIAGTGVYYWYIKVKGFLESKDIGPGRSKILATVLMTSFVLFFPVTTNAEYFALKPGEMARKMYGDQIFAESIEIGSYLRRETSPRDTIYIFGSEPQILFYAKRKSCTPFTFTYPLWENTSGSLGLQTQVVSDIRSKRPRFIVYVGLPVSHLITDRSEKYLLKELNDIIKKNYCLDSVILVHSGGARSYYGRGELEKAFHNGVIETKEPFLEVSLHRLKGTK